MEAGWTLRRVDAGTDSGTVSEHTHADIRLATEVVARNNIAEGLGKISKLNFQLTR